MKKIIIANWKMNPDSRAKAAALARATEREIVLCKRVKTVIAPPFPFLAAIAPLLRSAALGAQDVSGEGGGPYTGEVSARQLKDYGVTHVIVGHSERRIHCGETNEMVNKKVRTALGEGMTPILCVGERERTSGDIPPVVGEQVRTALEGVKKSLLKNLIIAYEPVWAISTFSGAAGAETPDGMFRARLAIEKTIAACFDPAAAKSVRIIYGGSVSAGQIAAILSEGHMDGALVGNAGLDAKELGEIVRRVSVVTQ